MNLDERTHLLAHAEKDPAFVRLAQKALGKERRAVNVIGPGDTHKSYLCAALAAKGIQIGRAHV